jgi:hippurate hydrolase
MNSARLLVPLLALAPLFAADSTKDLVAKKIAADYPLLDALYKDLHAHPELSLMEERSAAKVAAGLRAAGVEVTEKFGGGHGVVGVLKNGPGPTVLLRCDLDGLPVLEETGLPHASKARVKNLAGQESPVMHACGHDLHMTCLVGTARALAAVRERWSGTVVFVGQPAEEIGTGARAMLAAGLYTKFPKPRLRARAARQRHAAGRHHRHGRGAGDGQCR